MTTRIVQFAETETERVAMGTHQCPECGWPVAFLDEDQPYALYENRQHIRKGVMHMWPQPHSCEALSTADACPVCIGCEDC